MSNVRVIDGYRCDSCIREHPEEPHLWLAADETITLNAYGFTDRHYCSAHYRAAVDHIDKDSKSISFLVAL
jgi:hypothetical protein